MRGRIEDGAAAYLLPDATGASAPGQRASPSSSIYEQGKPNTPESSKLRGEQHLQTASGRSKIKAVGGSFLPDMGTYRAG